MRDDDEGPAARFTWSDSLDAIDWRDVETLYRLAPLGNKSAAHLHRVFNNSRLRCLAFDGGKLIAAGRVLSDGADCSYVCDVAVLPQRMLTAMAIFDDQAAAFERGYLGKS